MLYANYFPLYIIIARCYAPMPVSLPGAAELPVKTEACLICPKARTKTFSVCVHRDKSVCLINMLFLQCILSQNLRTVPDLLTLSADLHLSEVMISTGSYYRCRAVSGPDPCTLQHWMYVSHHQLACTGSRRVWYTPRSELVLDCMIFVQC